MACVTEPVRMNVTLVILAPSDVSICRVWPYPTTAGVKPLSVGRAPRNR